MQEEARTADRRKLTVWQCDAEGFSMRKDSVNRFWINLLSDYAFMHSYPYAHTH